MRQGAMDRIWRWSSRAMRMDEAAWARHANPWSGYSRLTCLPLIVLAIWSRTWIGAWALLPLAAALVWTWINPRLFPPPRETGAWITRGTFGERALLSEHGATLPRLHLAWARGLSVAALAGAAPLGWGLVALDPGWTLFGLCLAMGAKLWFVDRMVWPWDDVARLDPALRARIEARDG